MPVVVRVPTPLRKVTNGQETVDVGGATVEEGLANLESQYPGIKERIVDANGQLHRFVNIYVNDEDIRYLERENTPISNDDSISIVPSIACGSYGV